MVSKRKKPKAAEPEPAEGMALIEALDKVVVHHGINMNEICRNAKVGRSVWTRWKTEAPASFKIYDRLCSEVEAAVEAKKERARGGNGKAAASAHA